MTSNLAVLIPTYKRSNRIEQILGQLSRYAEDKNLRIYVAENGESSELESVIAKFRNLDIKHLPANSLYSTGEENLFRAWDYVEEEYVWIIGDDDVINFEVLNDLTDRCSNGDFLALKYNSRFITESGKHLDYFTSRVATLETTNDTNSIAARLGFWHTLASFSTWVIKRELISSAEAMDWVKSSKSPIYSHVSYFLHVLNGKPINFVNLPLVYYRVNGYVSSDDHWGRYSKISKKPRNYPWTVGFAAQLNRLIEEDAIEIESIRASIGDHLYVGPFSENNSMINLFLLQLISDLNGKNYSYSKDDVLLMLDFLRKIRPELVDLFSLVERFINSIHSIGKISRIERKQLKNDLNKYQENFNSNMSRKPAEHLLVSRFNGYNVYQIGKLYVSVIDSGNVFEYITLEMENKQNFFVDPSLKNLCARLQLLPIKPVIIHSNEELSWKSNNLMRFLKKVVPLKYKVIIKTLISR